MLNETLLIKRLRAKDENALHELINEFELRLLRIARLLTADQQEAEELVYDTFTSVFFSINKFKRESSLFRWLYRILLNKFHDQLRRRKREVALKTSFQQTTRAIDTPEKQIISKQDFLCLFSRLSADQREVILLKYLEGIKVKETVKTRLHHAIANLRKIIKEMNLLPQ